MKNTAPTAFSLIELLVVVAAIAVLVAMFLPTAAAIRDEARTTRCASNLRQIALGLQAYGAANGARYPQNVNSANPQYWFDRARAGQFLGDNLRTAMGSPGGGILACPADPGGERSYSMNIWASSQIDGYLMPAASARGRLWGPACTDASKLILMTESWSYLGSESWGWFANPTLGLVNLPAGQQFGANGGIAPPMQEGRWGSVNSELPYMRHRPLRSAGTGTLPNGRVNIAYADGHVALKSQDDLADFSSGLSTLDSLWFPGDTGK